MLISMVKDESDLLLFMDLSRCRVVQFLRDAVSIFSFLLGERRTDKAGASAAETLRGFWFSQISIWEKKQLQNAMRKDFGVGFTAHSGEQVPNMGSVGWRLQSVRTHIDFSSPSFTSTCEMLSHQNLISRWRTLLFLFTELFWKDINIAKTDLWQSCNFF